MSKRNEEAKGVLAMNRTQGAAASISGRPGAMRDKRRDSRSKEKANVRKEFF